MCRLFGMAAGTEPARATFWLLQAPDSLSEQSRREPDGTGLGWFGPDGHPHVSKQPLAAFEDRRFAREAAEVSSKTFIAHVRFASTGELTRANTHPFEQEGRLFAHNGVLGGLDELDAELAGELRLVHGQTDSERLFALITREIARHDGDVAQGIGSACSWVADRLPLYAINLLLAQDGCLWALRYPETHPLYLLVRDPGKPLAHESRIGTRVHVPDGERRPLVTIASEPMDDDPGWELLPSGELVGVDEQLQPTRQMILPRAPTHPLTLADLGTRAQASQTPGGPSAEVHPESSPGAGAG
jgi:predicted glutamine amidotransferase